MPTASPTTWWTRPPSSTRTSPNCARRRRSGRKSSSTPCVSTGGGWPIPAGWPPEVAMEIAERAASSPEQFAAEVVARHEPAVLRGVVADWPAVRAGLVSAEALAAYLDARDAGAEVDVLSLPASEHGRIYYGKDFGTFNYARDRATISAVNARLLRSARFANRATVVAQSALLRDCL